jgi:orotate phosphoribosyltransferase/AMMECR1 domain-containing protein
MAADQALTPGARDRLRTLLRNDGVLWSTPEHPVLHRNGATAPWMFYSWNVTMTCEGLQVAADALLERLASFESTQLAGHGVTSLPLVSACVALSNGRYSGLAIRKERKTYLSGRQIEGPGDPRRPVVVIDDSISSGTSLHEAVQALEREGYQVEGSIALVSFPGRGGLAWANASGYRTEALLDVAEDLQLPLHRRPQPLTVPLTTQGSLRESTHPCDLARSVAEHWLRFGTRPLPPQDLDEQYVNNGGVFVSFRRQRDDERLARDGFWHLPGSTGDDCESVPRAADDVVDATIRTLRTAPGKVTLANLGDLKIAVTFMGELEQIAPSGLDFWKYAIVCVDAAGVRRGGALPNTQVFSSETQQYRHALQVNGAMAPTDAHTLYRQTVRKVAEPGSRWPAYGEPDGPQLAWADDLSRWEEITGWAASHLPESTLDAPAPADLPYPIEGVAVSLYRRRTLGVATEWAHEGVPLADLVRQATHAAVKAAGERSLAQLRDAGVMVTVLHERERFADNRTLATMKLRRGLDAVRCDRGDGRSVGPVVALPGALVYNGWTKDQVVAAACADSGGTLSVYRTVAWLRQGDRVDRIATGFPARGPMIVPGSEDGVAQAVHDAHALADYTARNMNGDGVPAYCVDAVTGVRTEYGTGPRHLHALAGLLRSAQAFGRPDWQHMAERGFRTYLAAHGAPQGGFAVDSGGALADAVLFDAIGGREGLFTTSNELAEVARRLRGMLRSDGSIALRPTTLGDPQDTIFLPGAVLTALAKEPALLADIPAPQWDRMLAIQRARFDALRSWGMVGWSAQGWAAVHAITGDGRQADFVLELADWAVERQVLVTGAFLEDLSPDEPSFNTGFVSEGICAAWAVALRIGDTERAARYAQSWLRANHFMRTLMIRPGDEFVLADPDVAMGGVRLTPSRPEIRADSVSHWHHALVRGIELSS